MIRGLCLLCEGNNSKRALDNLSRAKEEIRRRSESNGQFYKLLKYESIVYCINSADDKSSLTIEEIAKITEIPVDYIKGHMYSISLYALTPKQITDLSIGKGKYAGNGQSEHTIPICSLPTNRARHFVREI